MRGWAGRLACLIVFGIATLASAQNTIHVPSQQPTIEAGINAANNGDTVLVAPGTYKENINFNGKAITVISESGAAKTTIQGDGTTAVVLFASNETRQSVLNGFTITGGGTIPNPSVYGGGVYVNDAFPTILNNNIINNPCHGIDVDFSGPLIQGNTISGTDSLGVNLGYCNFEGNGILLIGYSYSNLHPEVIGNTIVNNQHAVQYDGGGIELWAADGSVIEDNIIANNATTGQGGGIVSFNTDAMIIAQNLFYGNHAQGTAAGLAILAPGPNQEPFIGLIQDNTFAGNVVAAGGSDTGEVGASQVYLEGGIGAYELTNNIIVGNDSNPAFTCGTTYNYLSLTPLVVDHNDIYNAHGPAYGGACPDQTGQYGNISADPMFKDAANNDYHLLTGSPAIDTGNNSALELLIQVDDPGSIFDPGFAIIPITTDLDGNPRVVDATNKGYPIIDMGAYELQGTSTSSEPPPTTMVLNPSSYSPNAGENFSLTANLYSADGMPPGTVTFFEDGNKIGTATIDSSGTAVLTLAGGLVPGTHAFLATYPGQSGFPPCESVKIYVIVGNYSVTMALSSTPNPSLVGQNVTFSIHISSGDPGGVPPGTITLSNYSSNTTLATLTPDKNGNATYSTSTLPVGVDTIQASYAGDSTHDSASAAVNQYVLTGIPTTTTLISSLDPSNVGNSVTFTATVTSSNGTPTGAVTFLDGTTTLGTVNLVNGMAACATASLAVGQHTITADYVPSSGSVWTASSASLIQTVNGKPTATTLMASPNPAYALQTVTLTAKVSTTGSGTPTGTVTFYDGGASLGPANLQTNGTATLAVKFAVASATPHQLTAVYSGDATFNSSTSAAYAETILFNPTSTVITSITPNPVGAYQSVTLTAKVDSTTGPISAATGTVIFSTGGTTLGTASLANGVAAAQILAGVPGSYPVIATYGGDAAFSPSTSSASTLTVKPEPSAVSLTSSKNPSVYGDFVTFTATAKASGTGTPLTGTFTFFDGKTQLGQAEQANSSGEATYVTSTLAVGTHPITAVYSGNTSVTGATSPVLDQVVKAYTGDFSLKITPSDASIYTGESANFTVTATPQGGFNLPLTLSCTGLPANATCAFAPATIKSGSYASTLTVQTAAPSAKTSAARSKAGWTGGATALACLCGLLIVPRKIRRRLQARSMLIGAILLGVFAAISGCGADGSLTGGTPLGAYEINVTAQTTTVAPQLSHTTTIKVAVKSLF